MAGLDISFDFAERRRQKNHEKERRRTEAIAFGRNLMDEGFTPEEVNRFVKNYQNDKFEIPTERTRMLPPEEGVDVASRSVREPIKFKSADKKRKVLLNYDKGTGTYDFQELPEDINDVITQTYDSKRDQNAGDFVIIDPTSGETVGRVPRKSKNDRAITKPRPASNSGTDPVDVALAKDTIKKGQAMILKGETMTPEFKESFESAAQMLNIPLENKDLPPTGFDKLRNLASDATKGRIDPAPKRVSETPSLKFNQSQDAEYQRDLQAARQAVAKKLVSPEEALKRLKSKYGRKMQSL